MREQIAHQYTRTGKPVQQRRRVVTNHDTYYEELPASQHRVGHQAGLHPEDTPYLTGDVQQRHTAQDDALVNEDEYDDSWPPRLPTSSRRYQYIPDATTRGNVNVVEHYHQQPLRTHRQYSQQVPQKPRRRVHPLLWVGSFFLLFVCGWIAFSSLGTWIQTKQDDWTYGQTRHFTIDAVVGHNDSTSSPSHFIGENDKGDVFVIELPAGESSKAKIYQITTIPNNDGNPPVKLSFQDLNRDGKPDMLVEIGEPGSYITIMLFNNGSQFVSKV